MLISFAVESHVSLYSRRTDWAIDPKIIECMIALYYFSFTSSLGHRLCCYF